MLIRGTGVSKGVARGTALVLACGYRSAVARRTVAPSEVGEERRRLDAAVERAAAELTALQREVSATLGPTQGDIFGAQLLVLQDPSLRERASQRIAEQHVNAEAAVSEVIDEYTRRLEVVTDTYLRERGADVRDVGRRVLSALVERRRPDGPEIPDGAIVIAEELLPSVTARLQLDRVRAFVTERGNRFSHSAILARSLGTPSVTAVEGASRHIRTGDHVIVDGADGVVFVNPEPELDREYARAEAELRAEREELRAVAEDPAVTLDGTRIPLLANVNKLSDTESALRCRADGIGLYRTEFAFSIRPRFPTEDEQYEFLARAAELFHPRKVVFRLLDLGGDKVLPYFPLPPSRNPSLAQRGIRLLLQHLDVLKPQLRAFLRVGAEHPASILIPVVGGVEDVQRARQLVRQVQRELEAEGLRFDRAVPLGAMIEVPSAALMARTLAREVDFLSLGTNDLVQYVLAADREDATIAPYYQPLHPAVLRLIQSVAEAASSAGCELAMCGEMAGDPLHTALLLGLGLRELSVAPGEMLEVKNALRQVRLQDARRLAERALELGTVAEIEDLVNPRRSPAETPDAAAAMLQ